MPKTTEPVVAPGTVSRGTQPQLRADGLVLRPWRPDDVPDLVAAYEDPAIQRWHVRSMTIAEAQDYVSTAVGRWTQETGASWAITDGSAVLGRTSVRFDLAEGLGWVGYWVVPDARGHGVAPRAVWSVSSWALTDLGLHRMELEHSTQNTASCRVASKAGYALEGTKRSQALHADGWHDMHLHVLVQGDPGDPGSRSAADAR